MNSEGDGDANAEREAAKVSVSVDRRHAPFAEGIGYPAVERINRRAELAGDWQLDPTEHGVPLEVYCFSKIKTWVEYEGIQSDIFDHVFAVAPFFDLEIFESPAGSDFQKLAQLKQPS